MLLRSERITGLLSFSRPPLILAHLLVATLAGKNFCSPVISLTHIVTRMSTHSDMHKHVHISIHTNQWRLVRGGRRIIMAGTEQMEWHQTHGNHVFDVFNTIPPFPLQPLPRARPPQFRCHQPPVIQIHIHIHTHAHRWTY